MKTGWTQIRSDSFINLHDFYTPFFALDCAYLLVIQIDLPEGHVMCI